MKRAPVPVILVALTALTGATLMILPSAGAWFSQSVYSQEIEALSKAAEEIQPQSRQTALEQARNYNASLIGSIEVAANSNIPEGSVSQESSEYGEVLSADSLGLMARLKVPSINVDLPIYHGTSEKVLEMGVGHLQGSSLPIGGTNTHSVLTAHRGLAKAELFTHLGDVQVGDMFTVEVFGEVLSYRVFETRVVDPADTESLYPQVDRDLMTLITCTPLGVNTHRILVTGERVTPTPIDDVLAAGNPPSIPGFPWWAIWALGSISLTMIYVSSNLRTVTKNPINKRDKAEKKLINNVFVS